jgi:adenylate cyclase
MAILAADVAGYSRLVGADEEGTLTRWKAHWRELIDPTIREHDGRIVRITGDGLLAEFASVIAAVRCAVQIQRAMGERNASVPLEKRIVFRMGINSGDVITEGTDLWGDSVNVAARLEALAEAGGICVSSRVQEDIRGKLDISLEDIGEQKLKNIAQPVRVYRLRLESAAANAAPALALPDKPSIAVLPFQNMSGDPEQEYFADGVVEEIITALSRIRWLFIIARNSSFVYKGRTVDVKQVGGELGVRYVLEGGVRKAADRVRITAQLIDVSNGTHLWAGRFEGTLDDIFNLQDQVTERVVGAIAPKLEQAEIERARHKPTQNLNAYDYYLRGLAAFDRRTKEATNEALQLFHKAIELDPDFSSAYGVASQCYSRRKSRRWMDNAVKETSEAAQLAWRAVELGKQDAVALSAGGFTLAFVVGDLENGIACIDRALALNPSMASAWTFSGWVRVHLGDHDVALQHFARSMRLSPFDPLMFATQGGIALAHLLAGRYDEASSWAEKSLREDANYNAALRILVASSALAGRPEKAHSTMVRLCAIDPMLRISDLKDLPPLRRPQDAARFAEGLRKAGLPE